ncbi:hypothetical protein J6590_087348 [Homalodisca vitripennis]|nr:hypothetical protein J6590_087348 [Homalodisca vitripennis]
MDKDWKRILRAMKFSAKYPEFYDKSRWQLDTWSLCPPGVFSDSTKHQVNNVIVDWLLPPSLIVRTESPELQ